MLGLHTILIMITPVMVLTPPLLCYTSAENSLELYWPLCAFLHDDRSGEVLGVSFCLQPLIQQLLTLYTLSVTVIQLLSHTFIFIFAVQNPDLHRRMPAPP